MGQISRCDVQQIYRALTAQKLSSNAVASAAHRLTFRLGNKTLVEAMRRLAQFAEDASGHEELRELLTSCSIDESGIMDAIDTLTRVGTFCGLCRALPESNPTHLLRELGGGATNDYFFELDETGFNERLLFLAFCLTWLNDLEWT